MEDFLAVLLLLLFATASCFARHNQEQEQDQAHGNLLKLKLHQRQTKECNVRRYGARGDGRTYETAAMQAAIDDCAESSPWSSQVVVPRGRYLTGTLLLRSNMTLHLQSGAVVLGSHRQKTYPAQWQRWYTILAEGVSNVAITGSGSIDGQSRRFVIRKDPVKNVMVSWNRTGHCRGDECRPRLVGFLDSVNVRVSGISLLQPAYWCLHVVRCNKVSIHDVVIRGDFNTPNNDGIDIEDSNHTVITRCNISTGDDAICPKTYSGPVYNLKVTNCWIKTKSSAIKLGSASYYDFVGLSFENITIVDSHRGIGLQIRDKGNVDGVTFSNIHITTRYYDPSWWGRAEPIYVTACPRHSNTVVGKISNIHFSNITATSENGIFLSGSAGSNLSQIKLTNININLKRWTSYNGGLVDYRPGCQGLVKHRTAGIIMEYISYVRMNGINMTWASASRDWDVPVDFTPSTVKNVAIREFQSFMY